MKPTREIDGSVPWNAPPLLLWHCRHLDKSPRVASMLESRSLSDGYYCQTQTWDRFHRLRTPLTSSNVANVIKCRHLHHVAGIILSPTLMNVLHKMDERRKIRLQADKYARRSNHSPIMTANKVTTSTRDATELVYRYYSHHPPPSIVLQQGVSQLSLVSDVNVSNNQVQRLWTRGACHSDRKNHVDGLGRAIRRR